MVDRVVHPGAHVEANGLEAAASAIDKTRDQDAIGSCARMIGDEAVSRPDASRWKRKSLDE